MKKKYKALMLDLDGTTIPNKRDGMPSKKVTAAVKRVNRIVNVVIATSRPVYDVLHITKHLSLDKLAIVSGGAEIINLSDGQLLMQRPIDIEDAKKIITVFKKYKVDYVMNDDGREIEFKQEHTLRKPLHIASDFLDPKLAEYIRQEIALIPTIKADKVHSWFPGKDVVMASHAEATKQHGIMEVAKILGIETHEIIGVGDGYNDFPLLMACGLKVAMGNAVPELKEIADYIAPTVDEDGVADVIKKFIL